MNCSPSAALVIGVSRYDRFPRMEGALPDARKLAPCFSAHGFHTVALDDEREPLTRARIVEGIARYVAAVRADAAKVHDPFAVFCFSGHGAQQGAQTYPHLVPSDGDPDDPDTWVDLCRELLAPLNGIAVRDGRRKWARLRVAIVLDCCRLSGSDTTWRSLEEQWRVEKLRNDFYVLFACDPGRRAEDTAGGGPISQAFAGMVSAHPSHAGCSPCSITSLLGFVAVSVEARGKQRPRLDYRPSLGVPCLYVSDCVIASSSFRMFHYPLLCRSVARAGVCTAVNMNSIWTLALAMSAVWQARPCWQSIWRHGGRALQYPMPWKLLGCGMCFGLLCLGMHLCGSKPRWRCASAESPDAHASEALHFDIVEQPHDVSVQPGDPATLTIETCGPVEFQWEHDGVAVLHETASRLHIPKVGRRHVGTYAVRLSNRLTGRERLSGVAKLSLVMPKPTRLHMLFPAEDPTVGWSFAKMDLVFVHDIWGEYKESWTNAQGTLWPSKFIFWDFPYLRTLSYDYPSAPSFWLEGVETLALQDRAKNLLDQLLARDVGGRPVLFVGHGLGGILVKVLLVSISNPLLAGERAHRIFRETAGVVFYATPHLGTEAATFTRPLSALLRLSPATGALASLADRLLEVHDAFGRLCASTQIRTRSFSAAAERGGLDPPVVPEWSANPRLPCNDHTVLSASHQDITRPRGQDDERYVHFSAFLAQLLEARGIGLDCPWSPHYRGP